MDEKFYKEFGKRVSDRRKSINISQEELAEKLNVSVQMVSGIECGKKALRLPKLVNLSNILGVSVDYLLTGSIAEVDIFRLSNKITDWSPEDFEFFKNVVTYIDNK